MTSLLDPISLDAVTPIFLSVGPCEDGHGYDLLDAIALHAGENRTSFPECVSETATPFLQMVNDALPDSERQHLLTYVEALAGTGKRERDHARREQDRRCVLLDSGVRVFFPVALTRLGLTSHIHTFAGLSPILQPAGAIRVAEELEMIASRAELAPAADLIHGLVVACRTLPEARTRRDIGLGVLKVFDPINLCFASQVRLVAQHAAKGAIECVSCLIDPRSTRRGWLRQKAV